MPPHDTARRILALAETLFRWTSALVTLDGRRRGQVARYADQIADTLGRAADAATNLDRDPKDRAAARVLVREFGRLSGYLETVVGVLKHHLDGRKLAGVKRRLEVLRPSSAAEKPATLPPSAADRLAAAEGYFRALADALRA